MDKDVEQQLSSRPDLSRIVRTAIYPGVGIARIGNSREPEGFSSVPKSRVLIRTFPVVRGMKPVH